MGGDAGAPLGDPKDMPPPKPLLSDNEWQAVKDGLGQPDLIIAVNCQDGGAVVDGAHACGDGNALPHSADLGM